METPLFLRKLPPFPAVATRLLRLLSREDASFAEAARLLRSDAALSAELLRLANSPLISHRRVDTILQALSFLGVERLNSLVISLTLCKFLAPAARCEALRLCWRHNLACAVLSDRLALAYGRSPDAAYTCGLLHDIGRLALLVAEPARYNELLIASDVSPEELCAMETASFGIDHCQAGALLVEQWGLPLEFREIVLHHHAAGGQGRSMTGLVHVACAMADMLGFQVSGSGAPWDLTGLKEWLPAGGENNWNPDELICLVAERINALECAGCAVAA
ncbi:MAG: HDOD domain-containing protein [Bryobacteraceae bacterium]